jgi:hypothetical protein
MPRKLRIHWYPVLPGKSSILELLLTLGPDFLQQLFPNGLLPHDWPWTGVNSFLTMLMMTGEVPLIPYHITLNTNHWNLNYPCWWGAAMERHGIANVVETLLKVQSWDVPPEIGGASFDFLCLGRSMHAPSLNDDEDGPVLREALHEAKLAMHAILTLSATSINSLSLTTRRDVSLVEFWNMLPAMSNLKEFDYTGDVSTHSVDSDGFGPSELIEFVPKDIEYLCFRNCQGFGSHSVEIFVRRVADGDFQQLTYLCLEHVFGEMQSARPQLDLLHALATLPKLARLYIGPVIQSKEVTDAVDALRLARPTMYVHCKRN